jgi:hypothetical protein
MRHGNGKIICLLKAYWPHEHVELIAQIQRCDEFSVYFNGALADSLFAAPTALYGKDKLSPGVVNRETPDCLAGVALIIDKKFRAEDKRLGLGLGRGNKAARQQKRGQDDKSGSFFHVRHLLEPGTLQAEQKMIGLVALDVKALLMRRHCRDNQIINIATLFLFFFLRDTRKS